MSNEENDEATNSRIRNLRGLLNFCTELTAVEDTTQPSESTLDPARREFLQRALEGLQTDVGQRLALCLQKLESESVTMPGDDVEEQEVALEQLADYVCDLNYAIDLHKMGGFPLLVRCLNSPHASLRSGAASLIGDICQNLEYCQKNMLGLGVVPMLLQIIDSDSNELARVKAFYALSCLVRDFPEGERAFTECDGLSCVMRAMQSGVEKLVIKSAFLLNNLLLQSEEYKDTILSMGYIEQLTTLLRNESTSNMTREHCCSSLRSLVSSNPSCLPECLRPELGLPLLLQNRLALIKGKDEFKEEEECITELIRLLPETGDDELNIR